VYGLLVLGVLNIAGYYAVNASGTGSNAAPIGPVPVTAGGPSDNVTFGHPAFSSATCGDGQNITVESVPWVSATVAPVTSQVFVEVVEQLDGDIDGGPEPTPAVTATSVCAGAPLDSPPSWYVVLRAPAGENIAVFSYSTNWVILSHTANAPIANASTLVLIANPQLSGTSLSLCVMGDIGTVPIQGCQDL
jgi:hypothetical protein